MYWIAGDRTSDICFSTARTRTRNCPISIWSIELLADKVTSTTLAAPITATQTSITVQSANWFPVPGFTVVIGVEIIAVTAVTAISAGNTTWAVKRGQQGTTAAPAIVGDAVILTTPANPPWKQTPENLSAAQLSAAPVYFNQGAFSVLFNASYPQSLPYSAGLDELRTYLQQWNLPLWQLRQALLPLSGATVAQQAAVAAARLGLNVQAENLIANPTSIFLEVAWNIANPASALVSVPAFLQAASITYESLLELLEVSWVQGGLNISLQGVNDLCEISSETLTPSPLDAGFLNRAHRFLRLWGSTGYKMWELDLLLTAPKVGNGTLDQNALIALQAFWQLQKATGLAVDQLLAFYQNLDTNTHRDPDGTTTTPRYSQIFLNPTTTWIAPDPDLVSLSTGGVIGDPLLGDHAKAIQPALGVSASDLTTLVALSDNKLTLDNLSLIYRINALAVASKFSISNLLNFASLLNPVAGIPATSLNGAITNAEKTITVASATPFGPPNFYIKIGAEILLVTAMGGAGNATWTVLRGQLGTTAAAALNGAAVTSDSASPAPALAALFSSPAATLAFLAQATAVQQQSSLTLDAISYLLTPPSQITGGWATTSQMTPANIATTLGAVQQAVLNLLSAKTTLTSTITAGQTSITVASDAAFPAPNFNIYIGSEILLVTAVSGAKNTTWTVVRGQQGTTAAAANSGAVVTPTAGDLNGAVIAAVAANAHSSANAPLANDVTGLILQNLQVPGTGQSLLTVLMDPALLAAAGTITIGGSPTTGVFATPADAQVTISWDAVPGAASYNIYWSTASGVTTANGTKITGAANPYIQTSLSNGTPYYYIVTAVNSVGEGAPSPQVSATPAAATAIPSAPTGVSATPGDPQTITISWDAVPGAASYNIYWSTASGVTTANGTKITGAANPYIQTSLTSGTPYYYLVTAVNSVGEGAPSPQVSATPAAPSAVPPPPTGLSFPPTAVPPAPWDTLQAVLSDGTGPPVTVSYPLTAADIGNVNQTASDFAQAINLSPAVLGPQAFLAPCTVSGAVITLTPLTPGAAGSSITSTNSATPGGVGHVSVSPATTQTIGQPAFQNQFLAIQLFDKVGVLVRGLRLVATDLTWLRANAAVYGGLDFSQLPVTASQPALSLSPLLTTLLVIKLARLWTAAPPSSSVQTLYDIIGGVHGSLAHPHTAATQTALATITGWPLADIESFATALGLVFPASYKAPATYDALRTLEAMTTAVNACGRWFRRRAPR